MAATPPAQSALAKLPTVAKIGIGAALSILVFFTYWFIFYSDIAGKIEGAQRQKASLHDELATQQQAEATYFADRGELALREQRARELNKVLPADPEEDAFLSSVQQASNAAGIDLLRGIEDGWFMSEIAEAAFQYQVALEKGDKKIVGVNVHTDSITHDLEILRVSHEVEVEQVRALAERRTTRDDAAARAAVERMVEVGRTDGNMIEAMLEACRAEATLGEICDALRAEWGEYREPARF